VPRFAYDDLVSLGERILMAAGVPSADASLVAGMLVGADLRGYAGHGLSHIHSYIERIRKGLIQLDAKPETVREGKSSAVIDGRFYIGQVVAYRGMGLAIEKAKEHGVGIVLIRHAGHVGRLADYVELAAESGMIGFAATSVGGGNIAPYGGMQPIAGTNPMAYGVPGKNGEHIIFDFATSSMSMGEFHSLVERGGPLPEGMLLDGYGNPTTDFAAFRGPPRGVMLPFGGYKGSGLHMMSNILGGLLSGNGSGMDWLDKGASAVNAVFLQAISVEEFQPLDEFAQQVADFGGFVRSRKAAPGFDEIRLPGDRSRQTAARQLREGIDIHDDVWHRLVETAEELDLADLPTPMDTAADARIGELRHR
jgi:LDH2 family malate/lactate/ureidoglycolate dehydrogenase